MKMAGYLERIRRLPWRGGVGPIATQAAAYAKDVGIGRFYLRACSVVGAGARVHGGPPQIDNRGYIELGANSALLTRVGPVFLQSGEEGRLTLGEACVVNFGTLLSASKQVRIGARVSIGHYSIVADSERGEIVNSDAAEAIEIEDDVWLAARVTVLPGSKIGRGSVIAAGSVVSGEIPAGVVAGGIPARVLRRLDGAGIMSEQGESAAVEAEQRSSKHLINAEPKSAPLFRGVIASDFTIDTLERELNAGIQSPTVDFECAPFGQVVPTLLTPPSGDRDTLVVWTQPNVAIPAFQRALSFEMPSDDELRADVDAFCQHLLAAATRYSTVLVCTWVIPPEQRGLGMLDARAGGVRRALCAINLRLMERLQFQANVFVLDAQRWVQRVGKGAQPAKLWFLGKVPFHPEVFVEAAKDIKAALAGLKGQARKLLVLDLDDTLWGGIVGDAGWENLRLGGHDAEGESFVEFQRAVRDLKRRGIILALASKNEESVALEAIEQHPEMVLRKGDFVAWRINWNDKAANIADLTAELNLGLQSVVFIDDNPVERARVREALPEVFVPEWPKDKLQYTRELMSLSCFDAPSLSKEDGQRTEMYVQNRERSNLRSQVSSVDEWQKSLGIVVRAERLAPANTARATQLLNKTNQLNLTTRRLNEAELLAWVELPATELWVVTVSDRFGDAGLTGIVSLEYRGKEAWVVDFLLSCRVMGRRVEEAMVHLAVRSARHRGATTLRAKYERTKKNKPVLEFWKRSGFKEDGAVFSWVLDTEFLCPDSINLVVSEV